MSIRKWKAPKNWQALRKKVLDRDRYICQVCGAKIGRGGRRSHVHHRVGRSIRGADRPNHLISLCATCHQIISLLSGNAKALVKNPKALEKAVDLAKEYLNSQTQTSS